MYGSILTPLTLAGAGYGFLASKRMNLNEKETGTEVAKVAAWTIPVTMLRIFSGNTARTVLSKEIALLYALPGSFLVSGYVMALGRQTAIMSAVFYHQYKNHLNYPRETMV